MTWTITNDKTAPNISFKQTSCRRGKKYKKSAHNSLNDGHVAATSPLWRAKKTARRGRRDASQRIATMRAEQEKESGTGTGSPLCVGRKRGEPRAVTARRRTWNKKQNRAMAAQGRRDDEHSAAQKDRIMPLTKQRESRKHDTDIGCVLGQRHKSKKIGCHCGLHSQWHPIPTLTCGRP